MNNTNEGKFRHFIMMQLGKMQKVYMPVSLMLLVLTNTLLFIPYFENRNIHPYISVIVVSSSLFILLLFIAHIYVRKFGMNQFQHRADIELNPFAVNHLSPLDEMRWRTYYIPSMTAYYEILKNIDKTNPYLKTLEEELNKIQQWVDIGYIPSKHAPEHLKPIFDSIRGHRL